MHLWRSIGAIALLTFPSLGTVAEDAGCANRLMAEERIPIKEILHAVIVNAQSDWGAGNLYVEFDHMGHRGWSLPLTAEDLSTASESSGTSISLSAPVSLPTRATEEGLSEPIKCKIKRDGRFFPDMTLFTADIDPRDQAGDEVSSIIRDRRGNDTGAHLKLILWDTEWVKGQYDFDDVDDPPASRGYIDFFYLGLKRSLGFLAGAMNFNVGDLEKPTKSPKSDLPTHTLLEGSRVVIPKEDEFIPTSGFMKIAPFLNRILRVSDRNNPLKDRASMKNEVRTRILKRFLPEPWEGLWQAPLSDASMHRIFFNSLGMFFIRKVNATIDSCADGYEYVFDATSYGDYEYKKNMESLALKVYFNRTADIALIEDYDGSVYQPGRGMWEWAKLRARSAAFASAAQSHLGHYHLHWANIPGIALRKFLQPDHPLRMVLTPQFFRTHLTCLIAKDLLLARNSPVHRVMPFEYEGGHVARYNRTFSNFQFKTWPEELEEKGMLGDEYLIGATDGIALHKVLLDYASNLIDEIYPDTDSFEEDAELRQMHNYLVEEMEGFPAEYSKDNLKKSLGEILFRVTGGHSSIGNSGIYAIEPLMVNLRMQKDQKGLVRGNRESMIVINFITGSTLPKEYPTLSDNWSNVTHSPESKAYFQLDDDLMELGKKIDERNKVRRFVNVDFHPDYAMLSVFG